MLSKEAMSDEFVMVNMTLLVGWKQFRAHRLDPSHFVAVGASIIRKHVDRTELKDRWIIRTNIKGGFVLFITFPCSCLVGYLSYLWLHQQSTGFE
jgi:hypothetical protein